jgi:hypothetical protein
MHLAPLEINPKQNLADIIIGPGRKTAWLATCPPEQSLKFRLTASANLLLVEMGPLVKPC